MGRTGRGGGGRPWLGAVGAALEARARCVLAASPARVGPERLQAVLKVIGRGPRSPRSVRGLVQYVLRADLWGSGLDPLPGTLPAGAGQALPPLVVEDGAVFEPSGPGEPGPGEPDGALEPEGEPPARRPPLRVYDEAGLIPRELAWARLADWALLPDADNQSAVARSLGRQLEWLAGQPQGVGSLLVEPAAGPVPRLARDAAGPSLRPRDREGLVQAGWASMSPAGGLVATEAGLAAGCEGRRLLDRLPEAVRLAHPQAKHLTVSLRDQEEQPLGGAQRAARLERAVLRFVNQTFFAWGYRVIWAIHDEPGGKPHAHLVVRALDDEGRWRLRFARDGALVDGLRHAWAEAARAEGFDVEATRRLDRAAAAAVGAPRRHGVPAGSGLAVVGGEPLSRARTGRALDELIAARAPRWATARPSATGLSATGLDAQTPGLGGGSDVRGRAAEALAAALRGLGWFEAPAVAAREAIALAREDAGFAAWLLSRHPGRLGVLRPGEGAGPRRADRALTRDLRRLLRQAAPGVPSGVPPGVPSAGLASGGRREPGGGAPRQAGRGAPADDRADDGGGRTSAHLARLARQLEAAGRPALAGALRDGAAAVAAWPAPAAGSGRAPGRGLEREL